MSSAIQQAPSLPIAPTYSKQRLTISYNHPVQQQVVTKNFLLSGGEMVVFETILRHAYQIPSNEAIMLQLNDSEVIYPVSNLDVEEAAKAYKIEISTFPLPQAQPAPGPSNQMAPSNTLSAKHFIPPQRDAHNKISDEEGNQQAMKLGLGLGKLPPKAKKATNVAVAAAIPVSTPAVMTVPAQVTKKAVAAQMSDEDDEDNANGNKDDKRRFNRGLDHRKSYLKEEKILVMLIKDTGKSAEEIASMTNVSKSNVEKWCSDKTREKILHKYCAQAANRVVQQAMLPSNKLHFDVSTTSVLYALINFLFEKLRTLSSDSGIMLSNVAQLLNLPNNAAFGKYIQSGAPPSITPPSQTPATSAKYLSAAQQQQQQQLQQQAAMPVPESPMMDLNEEEWEDFINPDADIGPVLKKKKESDPHHQVASILYQMGTSGNNSPLMGAMAGTASVGGYTVKEADEEEEDDDDDEDNIMQELMAQVQAKRNDRLVTTRTFKEKRSNGNTGAKSCASSVMLPPKSNYTSDITMQYNDNITWNMEALLSAASIMSKDLSSSSSSAAAAGTAPNVCPLAASTCPKTLQSTTSLQAKRQVLSNTKYVVAKKQEEMKRLEALQAMDVVEDGSSQKKKAQKEKQQREDDKVLKILGE